MVYRQNELQMLWRLLSITGFVFLQSARRYTVTLEPGQVLYVPKHWWHYVECDSTAISVNTWIELVNY